MSVHQLELAEASKQCYLCSLFSTPLPGSKWLSGMNRIQKVAGSRALALLGKIMVPTIAKELTKLLLCGASFMICLSYPPT